MLKLVAFSGALLIGIGSASAQTGGAADPKAGSTQMTSAQCESLWSKVDSSHTGLVTSAQAQPYITVFKKADSNSDGKLSSSEFTAACQAGMAKDSASTGAATGSSGTKSSK